MTESQVIDILQKKKAILRGHFELSSGRHSDTYVQCAKVFADPTLTIELAKELVKPYVGKKIDVVVAPAVGGITLGFAVAYALEVRMIFSERVAGKMVFRREFNIFEGEKVLVVEDVITTGGTTNEVIDLVGSHKGGVAGILSLVDRNQVKTFEVPYYFLANVKANDYLPVDCPMCKAKITLTSPGSRKLRKEE